MKKNRIRRFTPVQRIFHALLILSFLTQSATGLARTLIASPWGKKLAAVFGGYDACLTVHKVVGIIMIFGFIIHVFYVFFKIDWKNFPRSIFGPDSLVPGPEDIKDFFKYIGWLIGLKKAPAFDRWVYWEKFDYWAVFWGMAIMGGTGLILAYPIISTRYMPGFGLNILAIVHREEATLAMGYVFIVHFFNTHLRPFNFPMDRAMFEGSIDMEAAQHEKTKWVNRLKNSGTLHQYIVEETGIVFKVAIYLVGYTALSIGIFLLLGAIINSRYITW